MPLDQTLRRFPAAAADFAESIFGHHWIEASWLYERRDVLREQGALLDARGWRDVEDRADAHVAALAKGGRLVFDQCEARALEGDVGDLHTTVRLLARTGQPDEFNALVERLDWQEPDRARAIVDALTWDAPDSWRELVSAILEDEAAPEDALGPLALVAGRRGWPVGDALLGVLEDRVGDIESVCWALGALGYAEARAELHEVVQEPLDASVRLAAAVAATRIEPHDVVGYAEQIIGSEPWAAIVLAIAGGPRAFGVIEAAARNTGATHWHMHALGVLGCAEGVECVLEFVEDPDVGWAAAEGLYLLTGAELHAERAGGGGGEGDAATAPRDAGEPSTAPGLFVQSLPQSVAVWRQWLDQHPEAIEAMAGAGPRIRFGGALSPEATLDSLGATTLSAELRDVLLHELHVRYRLGFRAWSSASRRMIESESERAREHMRGWPDVKAGEWFLGGKVLR